MFFRYETQLTVRKHELILEVQIPINVKRGWVHMISKYIYITLNTLSIIILVYFMYTRIRTRKDAESSKNHIILLKTGIDDINVYLSVFLTLLIFWRIDTAFSLSRGQILLKNLFLTDAFVITNCIIIALYYIINRNTITTVGIARLHLFNNFQHVIKWNQIVNYQWEENCLIISYLKNSEIDTYLWKNISYRDKEIINSIFNSYL